MLVHCISFALAFFSFYVKKTNHKIMVIIIYVDDLIVMGHGDVNIFDLKKFEMKDLGELHYFFNIKVIKYPKRRRLLLHAICFEQVL